MVRTTDKILIPKVHIRNSCCQDYNNQSFQWLLFALVPFFLLSCVAVGLIVHHAGGAPDNPEPRPEPEPEPSTKVNNKFETKHSALTLR